MRILRVLIFLVLIVAIGGIVIRYSVGGFSEYSASEMKMGPYNVVYVDHVGDYKLMYKSMNPLYDSLSGQGIKSTMGIGIFYDNPDEVPTNMLRSEAGLLISAQDMAKLDKQISTYKIKTLATANYAVVKFPYVNMFSYFVGPQKAYPMLWEYLEDKGYDIKVPGIEIYDVENGTIFYMAELKK